jgi:hypothetical protein
VNDTTTGALRTILADAEATGGTLKEIEDRVRDAMNAMFDEAKAGRAKTIAITEVNNGIQHTQLAAWKDSGVVESKQWIASMMSNGRHNEMHDQVVPLDEPFIHPGGEFCDAGTEFDRPSGSGLPEQDINCHCDMAPVVSEKAKMDFLGRKLERKLYPASGKGSRTWETKTNAARLLLSR